MTLSHDTDVGRVWSTLGAVDHALGQLVVGTAARHSTEQLAPVLVIYCSVTTNHYYHYYYYYYYYYSYYYLSLIHI